MEMLTFVLIIASTSYAKPVTAIPGYANRVACEQAVQAYLDQANKTYFMNKNAFCIPGPERR